MEAATGFEAVSTIRKSGIYKNRVPRASRKEAVPSESFDRPVYYALEGTGGRYSSS